MSTMTTINNKEIQSFKLADEWWDANGKFKFCMHLTRLELNTSSINAVHFSIQR